MLGGSISGGGGSIRRITVCILHLYMSGMRHTGNTGIVTSDRRRKTEWSSGVQEPKCLPPTRCTSTSTDDATASTDARPSDTTRPSRSRARSDAVLVVCKPTGPPYTSPGRRSTAALLLLLSTFPPVLPDCVFLFNAVQRLSRTPTLFLGLS